MKKKYLWLIAILVLALGLVFATCGNEHEHKWIPATCTTPKTCETCQETRGEPLGHAEEEIVGKPATCTEEGLTEGKKCSVCNEILVAQKTVEKLPHTEITVAGKEATCTVPGLTEGKKCSVCGLETVKQEEIPVIAHTEEVVPAKAATCTAPGLTEGKKCSVCGTATVKQEEIPATGHTEIIIYGWAPTCTSNGATQGKVCSVCGTKTVPQKTIYALGHKYVDVVYVWSKDHMTCTATAKCQRDGSHVLTETATVSVVTLHVSATKVTYTYRVDFANGNLEAQTAQIDEMGVAVNIVDNIATVYAPAITGRVASHDYVKLGFHDSDATYTFDVYYSEIDVWDGKSVSTGLSGSGTEEDPYLIQSGADLAYLKSVIDATAGGKGTNYKVLNFKGKYFKLTKSIDLNGANFMIGYHKGWNEYQGFAGIFDGNNCSIRGLKIEPTTGSAGLFACVQKGGIVKNLTLYGSVKGTDTVGSAVAYLLGTAENITSYVNVQGNDTLGGVVANAESKSSVVSNCVNYGDVTGSSYIVGGITGSGGNDVKNCTNYGNVQGGDESIGGIAGTTKDTGTITGCRNYGTVTGTATDKGKIGGIAGNCVKPVSDCVNYGTINGANITGGICGQAKADVTGCCNYGTVSGTDTTGGICGLAEGKTEDCRNYGEIKATSWNIGGIAGRAPGEVVNCTNYAAVATTADCAGGIVGTAQNKVSGCVNYGAVSGKGRCGGIAYNATSVIDNCTNHGTVTGGWDLGGILGYVAKDCSATITNCTNNGSVSGKSNCSGIFGFAPNNAVTVTITNCTNNGAITSDACDCIGITQITASNKATVTGCVENGTVTIKPHAEVIDKAVAETCTESGLTEGKHCSACGQVFIAQETIDAKGHDYVATYDWADDYSSCTASKVCSHDAAHVTEVETVTVNVVTINASASGVQYVYHAVFANSDYGTQSKSVDGEIVLVDSIATVQAPKFTDGRVASHDYVKFGFHDSDATYTFDIYYSEIDVWDGVSVSTGLSGSGTEEDPYLIQSGADLAYLKSVIDATAGGKGANYKVHNFKGEYFKLTKSIDLNGANFMIGYHAGWNEYECFAGIFDGNNCSIRGLNIEPATGSAGLFACVQKNAVIKNLTLYGSVKGTETVGSAVAYLLGTAENITSYVNVQGTSTLGGVIANAEKNTSLVSNCVNYGNVTGSSYIIGGITGSGGHNISNCTNYGSVQGGNESLGGIAGTTKETGTISGCRNYGTVTGTAADKGMIGGIAGYCVKPVSDCVNYGAVNGANTTGGIVGECTQPISDCVNHGAVNGGNITGGICGNAKAAVTGCENYGTVSGTDTTGGICGLAEGKTEDCRNYGEIKATSWNIGGIAGRASGEVVNCTNYAAVATTADCAGGVVGSSTAKISGCYNYGTIQGTGRCGGIAYNVTSVIENCINHGAVTGGWDLGGILGYVGDGKSATITNCTNNGDITGSWNNGGIFGLAHDNAGTVTITGCTNNGHIKATTGGQITIAVKAVITDCTENGSFTKVG